MKHYLLAFAIPLLAQTAHADDAAAKRAEAQRKIDELKLKGCQSLRSMLEGNKASCPEQAKEASTLTCSVEVYPKMQDLQHQCAGVMHAKADGLKKDSKSSSPASGSGSTPADKERARCTVTRVAGHDTSIDIPIKSKMFPDTDCKTHVREAAEKWLVANASCDPKKTVFPFTFTWGVPGKEVPFDRTGYCPIPKK